MSPARPRNKHWIVMLSRGFSISSVTAKVSSAVRSISEFQLSRSLPIHQNWITLLFGNKLLMTMVSKWCTFCSSGGDTHFQDEANPSHGPIPILMDASGAVYQRIDQLEKPNWNPQQWCTVKWHFWTTDNNNCKIMFSGQQTNQSFATRIRGSHLKIKMQWTFQHFHTEHRENLLVQKHLRCLPVSAHAD